MENPSSKEDLRKMGILFGVSSALILIAMEITNFINIVPGNFIMETDIAKKDRQYDDMTYDEPFFDLHRYHDVAKTDHNFYEFPILNYIGKYNL